ncbi:MAG: IS1380 family transposase [Elusimicrobia bacterium]|nr:IS1380 family transposase [Elusimicrobiota bacterium]
MTKNVLKFKLEFSEKEEITPYAGIGIYGEMYKAIGIDMEITNIFPKPKSGAGIEANNYIEPVVLMMLGGGKYIEDIRKINADSGLKKICKIKRVPSSDAIGDWLRRESKSKIEKISELNDNITGRIIKRAKEKELTLDIDATEIEAEKFDARYTYNGNKGYMPILGFIPELDLCCGYEFREGNVPPQDKNYEFTEKIIKLVKSVGKRIKNFRSDAAGYQAKLINCLSGERVKWTITADQDVSVKEMISIIPKDNWKQYKDRDGIKRDREYSETVHCMNKSDEAFRMIVQRWLNPEQDLFKKTEKYCYHVIATNYLEEEKTAEEVIWWHNGRSNSENYNKELKNGFNLDYVPCGEFGANAVWFGLGILAYNFFIASKIYLFPSGWLKKTISTVRWQFIQMAGKIIKRSRYLVMRICSTLRETYEIYQKARELCWELQYIL